MDKIRDRNPLKSEVIGRWGVDEKNKRPHRTDKSQTLKKLKLKIKSFYETSLGNVISESLLSFMMLLEQVLSVQVYKYKYVEMTKSIITFLSY